jgi:hypothetical protein
MTHFTPDLEASKHQGDAITKGIYERADDRSSDT